MGGEEDEELEGELNQGEMQDEGEVEGEEEGMGEEHQIVTLSAYSRNQFNRTLMYHGQINEEPITILIDTSATHSFISPTLVKGLKIPTTPSPKLPVSGAWGSREMAKSVCKELNFQIHNYHFSAHNLMVLGVQGYDLVLGYDWIAYMGDVGLRLSKGEMRVECEGKPVVLVTDNMKAKVKILEEEVNLEKECRNGDQVYYAQLYHIEGKMKHQTTEIQQEIEEVLQQFSKIFEEPKSLPPYRSIDHKIPLKPDSKPVNLRPYIFSHHQKTEVEKIVQDLLNQGFIIPSSSSYSSPVYW